MATLEMYKDDLEQEVRLSLWLAEKKYGVLDDKLKNKIRANARKKFLAHFVYGGVVSIPLLRSCNSSELQEIKKGISSISLTGEEGEEIDIEMTSSSTPEDEVIFEEVANLLAEQAPTFWGLYSGEIGLCDLPTDVRKQKVLEELVYALPKIYPELSGEAIMEMAERASSISWRDNERHVTKNKSKKVSFDEGLNDNQLELF